MTTTQAPTPVDTDKLMQFVFRAVDEVGATLNAALVVMGDKLGYYRDLAAHGPSTPGALVQIYEERMLFLLLLLRQPRLQLVFVTGRPVDERNSDYYLSLLPGVIPSHARARLHLVAADDGSARPLAAKLLERPRVLAAIRARIPDAELCHLGPFTTSTLERDLALALGIPLYGADPRVLSYGT